MASKIHHLQEIAGVRDLFALLDLVRDAKRYDSLVSALDERIKEVNRLIEIYGKTEDIDALRAKAQADVQAAARELVEARAMAAREVAGTQQLIDNAKEEASRIATAVAKEREDFDQFHRATLAKLEADRTNVAAESRRAAEQEAAARNLMAQAQGLKSEFESKLAKLRQAGVV